jgi:hypothetical protein
MAALVCGTCPVLDEHDVLAGLGEHRFEVGGMVLRGQALFLAVVEQPTREVVDEVEHLVSFALAASWTVWPRTGCRWVLHCRGPYLGEPERMDRNVVARSVHSVSVSRAARYSVSSSASPRRSVMATGDSRALCRISSE